eukprot:6391572-Ditylum_brightwellii.AAC.1
MDVLDEAKPPDPCHIPSNDILGVTVVPVICAYQEQEFVQIGHYANNEYSESYDEETMLPKPIDLQKVARQIL